MQPHAWRLLTCISLGYPSDHFLRPIVLKTQRIMDTKNHAIQTEGHAYISVSVYLLITSVSLATSICTPRITLCQREVM
jgi:hypothetical protein